MSAKSVGIGAPFRWFVKALEFGGNQQPLLGGFALLLLVAIIPTLIQMALQHGQPPSSGLLLIVVAVALSFSLLIMPPLIGGAFRMVHACDSGQPAKPTDIFALFGDTPAAGRMILVAILLFALLVAVAALLMLLPSGDFVRQFMTIAMSTPPGTKADLSSLPAPPSSFPLWLLIAFFTVLVVGNTHFFAYAQASLADRDPVGALGDGLLAVLKNFFPLLVFAIVATIVGFVALFVCALVLVVLLAVLSMISPILALIVGLPIYMGLGVLMYVLMFRFYYHAWREIFGFEPPPVDAISA